MRCARHLLRLLGEDRPLAKVDAIAVDAFIAARLEEGASRNTIGKELTTLRSTLKIARRRGQFPRSIDEVMPEQWSSGYRPRERALTREEADKLLGALPPHRAAHVAFILATGARWSESVRARREDVDLEGCRVYLRGTKTDLARRTVPVVPSFASFLAQALAGTTTEAEQMFRPWTNVRRELSAACTRAGIAAVSPNDLRRSCATWLRGAGVAPDLIGAFLGHKDSRMVERVYGRLPADILGELFRAHVGEAA
jgi:integrase